MSRKQDTAQPPHNSRMMRHTETTDVINQGRARNIEKDAYGARILSFITGGGYKITAKSDTGAERIAKMKDKTTLGILSDKVLAFAMIKYTAKTDFSNPVAPDDIGDFLRVTINFDEMALAFGYPDTESSHKQALKDIIPAAKALFIWQLENPRTGDKTFVLGNPPALERGGLKLEWTASYYEILASKDKGHYTLYPVALFTMTGSAYCVGRYLSLTARRAAYYRKETIEINGRPCECVVTKHEIAKVLRVSGYPDYSGGAKTVAPDDKNAAAKAARSRGHWRGKVKSPFERDLDKCKAAGVIALWRYTRGGKDAQPLTADELAQVQKGMKYDEYCELYIEIYTVLDADFEQTLKLREQKEIAARERAAKRAQRAARRAAKSAAESVANS